MRINLGPLRDLSGFMGAAVTDSESGLVLGTLGPDVAQIESAAAAIADVARTARRSAASVELHDDLDDVILCFRSQYHLARAIEKNPSILIYVALERGKANLGVALLALKQVEQSIEL